MRSFEAKISNAFSPSKSVETEKMKRKTAKAENASGSCGNGVTYAFKADTGTLTISGNGNMADYDDIYRQPWYSYKYAIKSIIIKDGITSIGKYAFAYCNTRSVAIPNTVISIGQLAFFDNDLQSTIAIPDSVASIGESAFGRSTSLLAINVDGNNLNYKSENGILFSKDGSSLIAYPAGKKDSSYEIPNSTKSIEANAFDACDSLKSVIIHSSLTSIGRSAFLGCSGLTSLTIPDGVKSIGPYALRGCTSLKSLTIPDSVTSIGESAFKECSSLDSVFYIGLAEPQHGESIFSDCNLISVNVPQNYKGNTFCGNPVNKVLDPYTPSDGNTDPAQPESPSGGSSKAGVIAGSVVAAVAFVAAAVVTAVMYVKKLAGFGRAADPVSEGGVPAEEV